MQRKQDAFWHATEQTGTLRPETHFGGWRVLCYTERPPDLDAMFTSVAARFADREAVVVDNQRLTYRDLANAVGEVAFGLHDAGIMRGDRVALLLGNCAEFVIATLACARAGFVCVPLGARLARPELAYMLNDAGASALIYERSLAANIPEAGEVSGLRRRYAVGDGADEAISFASLLGKGSLPPGRPVSEEDCAFILYTSGTTGRPKGAMLTHIGLVHSAMAFRGCVDLTERERAVIAIPISHVSGLVGIWLSTLAAGGCVVLMRHYDTRDFLSLAAKERMSYTIAVPAIYTRCLMEPDFDDFDLSSWRIGCYGGAPMPEATIRAVAARLPGLVLVNAYGATETTSPATIMPPGETASHPQSVGQVVPCGEIIVADEKGRKLPANAAGELWIRGPMVVPGYWNNTEATAGGFTEGFWRSGDIGMIDAEGFVHLFDRAKDMVNRAGYKVFSAEVENVLADHPHVVECAIVGRPDPVLGERVQAFIVPRDPALTAEEVRIFCATRLADYKIPEFIQFLQEPLPRNANGKVQKHLLRNRGSRAPSV
ncbi:MAG: acyl--CoA ligase [Proteobacteria bacterium]|nr:acyl--CoA ligase [Pseudomonadota bacterium]